MATATQSIPVSWDSLQNTKPWRALTAQQQRWCLAFISNGGDALEATRLSYNASSPRNSVCLSYEIRRNKNVLTFLDLYRVLTQGAPSREEQIAGALEMIREVPAYEQVKARRLLAQLTGFVRSEDDSEADDVPKTSDSNSRIPSGATALKDNIGVIRGYRTVDGKYVQLADVEVSR